MPCSHPVRDRGGQAEGSVQDPDDEGPGKQSLANSAGSERELQDQVTTSQRTKRAFKIPMMRVQEWIEINLKSIPTTFLRNIRTWQRLKQQQCTGSSQSQSGEELSEVRKRTRRRLHHRGSDPVGLLLLEDKQTVL
jgi:hypothetical protein